MQAMTNFRKFPSIERFHNLYKHSHAKPEKFPNKILYRARVKLHGTNAAIAVQHGKAYGQKRSNVVTLNSDNYNFAQFVESISDKVVDALPENTWLFGEWCGKGIQKNVALSQLEERVFVVFAVYTENEDGDGFFAVDQKCIDLYVEAINDPRVIALPWFTDTIEVNLFDRGQVKELADELNVLIDKVENECPFTKEHFDISGIGEGLVFVPVSPEYDNGLNIPRDDFSLLSFKAKGQKHEVVKTKRKAVELSPEEIKSQNEFVEKFCTENRLEQIAQEYCNNDFDMRNMGTFLKNFGLDIHKEARDELESNDIEWKSVIKPVQSAARKWFIMKNKEI